MDLKQFYRRVREVENSIAEPYVILVSLDTPDGGKAGVTSEATRWVAAKCIAEGRARLAQNEEAETFRERQAQARAEAEAQLAGTRMHVTLVSPSDLRQPKSKSPRE